MPDDGKSKLFGNSSRKDEFSLASYPVSIEIYYQNNRSRAVMIKTGFEAKFSFSFSDWSGTHHPSGKRLPQRSQRTLISRWTRPHASGRMGAGDDLPRNVKITDHVAIGF
jgi:hypothetical protein